MTKEQYTESGTRSATEHIILRGGGGEARNWRQGETGSFFYSGRRFQGCCRELPSER